MVLDYLFKQNPQLWSIAGLDALPESSQMGRMLKNYIISCKVEGKTRKTMQEYARTICGFVKFCQKNGIPDKPKELKPNDVRYYIATLMDSNLKAYSANSYFRCLHTFFNWAETEGYVSRNPMIGMKAPRLPKLIVRPFSKGEVERMLALCHDNTFLGLRNLAMILMFLDTGLRLEEMVGIRIADIDFNRETVKVTGKGSKEGIVRIGKRCQKVLLRYLLSRQDELPCLWVTEERRPMKKAGVQSLIRRLYQRAGIAGPKAGPHTFRHTAAIWFLRNGGGEFALQLMLRHTTLAMTRRYVSSLGEDDVIEAHKRYSPVDNMKL